jgi:hypothetical protein
VTTANLDFYSSGNAAYLEHLTIGADVLTLQEVKDIDVAALMPAGWGVCQDTSSDARAGSAVAYRVEAVALEDWWLVKGCDAPAGGGMLPRWICCADLVHDGGPLFAISAHAPPPRYAELQPGYAAEVAAVVEDYPDAIVGADANQDIDQWARALGPGMVAYGKQSGICLVTRRPVSDVTLDGWGEAHNMTDHPAVAADLP